LRVEKLVVIGKGSVASKCFELAKQFFKPNLAELLNYEDFTKKQLDDKFNTLKHAFIISANNFYLFKAPCIQNNTIINYHNALLPRHRGLNAHIWAIWQGDKKSGITWHFVDESIDTGKIITQKELILDDNTTSCELLIKQHKLAIGSLKESLEKIKVKKEFVMSKQGGGIYHTNILPNRGYLNLSWNEAKISRFLRSLNLGAFRDVALPKIKLLGKEFEVLFYELGQKEIKLSLSENLSLSIKQN